MNTTSPALIKMNIALPAGWRFRFFVYDKFVEFYFDIYTPNGKRWIWQTPHIRQALNDLGFWILLGEVFKDFREYAIPSYERQTQNMSEWIR